MQKVAGSLIVGLTALVAGAPQVGAQSVYGGEGAAGGTAGALAQFGGALTVMGGQVLVGEPRNTMRPGLVYVYGRNAEGAWVERQLLRGAGDGEVGDGFGRAIAASGERMLVGSSRGVHVFARDADGIWDRTDYLPRPAGLEGNAGFGAALALSGDVALVSAPGADARAGTVFVYRRGTDGWSADGTLPASELARGDVFGASLAFDGTHALVGAPNRDGRTGAVFGFRDTGTAFEATGTLPAESLERNDRFGAAVTVDGDVALVGVPFRGGDAGVIHRFAMTDGRWTTAGLLSPFDGVENSNFGAALALTDQALWVGAPRRNAAYLFEFDAPEGQVLAARKLASGSVSARGRLGTTLAADGGVLAAGALGEDYGAGSVAIFERADDGSWREAAVVASPPEGYDRVVGSEVACEGGNAVEWNCGEVDLVSFVPVSDLAGEAGARGLRSNDSWGWVDTETGRYYALVGLTDRVSFVDITDPVNPVVVGTLPMTEGANGSSWRDMKTYRDHAFVVSDGAGQHGMQIFDLTRLREHDGGEPVVFDEDAIYTRIASAHNVVINEETGFAYAVGSSSGGETCGGGLHMINIQDPTNPTFAGCFADPATGRASTGYSHDAQCVVYRGPDADYAEREICLGSNETALSIADVTDKNAPVAVSRATYPNPGYSHQGWISDDHRYFFMNDELDELSGTVARTRTIIWDLTDLDDPQLLAEHLGTESSSDHNLYITGNFMYQANYQSGLRILDISEPASPVEIAHFDTVPYGDNSPGFGGAWSNYPFFDTGVVLVSGGSEGLFLLRPNLQRKVF